MEYDTQYDIVDSNGIPVSKNNIDNFAKGLKETLKQRMHIIEQEKKKVRNQKKKGN